MRKQSSFKAVTITQCAKNEISTCRKGCRESIQQSPALCYGVQEWITASHWEDSESVKLSLCGVGLGERGSGVTERSLERNWWEADNTTLCNPSLNMRVNDLLGQIGIEDTRFGKTSPYMGNPYLFSKLQFVKHYFPWFINTHILWSLTVSIW